MVTYRFKFELNISDLDIHHFLTDINGVEPTQWFITKNGGKNKKDVFAYILNNTPEYIQLIPIKGNKKKHYIDTENIAVYHKNTDIERVSVIYGDINFYTIRIKLRNKTKFVMASYPWTDNDFHKWSMKAFKKEYKKSSHGAQIKSIAISCAFVLCVGSCLYALSYNVGREIADQVQNLKDQETIKEIDEKFEKNIELINSPEYKDLFSLEIQPYDSDAVLRGDTKIVEINSFRFTVDRNAEFQQFDSGDYSYSFGSSNHVLGVGYINTYNREDEVVSKNETVYEKIKDGTLEKMGYSMKSHYDMTRTKYFIDYFSDDINKFNVFEKIIFNYVVSDMISNYDSDRKVLAVYEKEFDSYYMIVEKMQHDEMHENTVYSYGIYIYFKDDLNTVESYSVTCMNHTEEECFAIINSMELIEE